MNEAIRILKVVVAISLAVVGLTIPLVLLGVKAIVVKCLIGVAIGAFVLFKKFNQHNNHHEVYHSW